MDHEKPKRPTCLQNLRLYFSQFCGATSIHGIQYLGEKGRYRLEKLIWLIIITTVSYFCVLLISKSYHKWQTSPVLVTFSTKETPIGDIPFPAVTICPIVKSKKDVFNFTGVVHKALNNLSISEQEKKYFLNMALLCDEDFTADFEDLQNLTNLKTDSHPLLEYSEIFPDMTDVNKTEIKWMGQPIKSRDLMDTYTREGLCRSFNMLDYRDIVHLPHGFIDPNEYINPIKGWSLDRGYVPSVSQPYPRKTWLSGIDGGFEITLFTNHSDLEYLCKLNPEGFKVTLHSPSDWPSMDQHFHMGLDEILQIRIKPKVITVSEELKTYKPKDRQCYFSDERKLEIFKVYTQQNCLEECLGNYTLEICGCVAFYMPNTFKGRICGLTELDCIKDSKINFLALDHYTNACNCLPSCNSLEYEIEPSQSKWNWKEVFMTFQKLAKTTPEVVDVEKTHYSKLVIYYKELEFLGAERHELYGYVDFFSSTGGLLGLFIGISVTSGIEILYFLTLRLACNLKKYGRKCWSGDEGLLRRESE